MNKDNNLKNINTRLYSSSERLIETISNLVNLEMVITESRHLSKSIKNLCFEKQIILKTLESKDDLTKKTKYNGLGISYGFGHIFNSTEISNHKYGIINIHLGNFKLYRGRHPVGWALIENKDYVQITAHKINEEIDSGTILKTKNIKILKSDDVNLVTEKCEISMDHKFFSEAITQLLQGKGVESKGGRYLPSLENKFEVLFSKELTALEAYNIFRAKSAFGEITIDGSTYKSVKFLDKNNPQIAKGKVIVFRDGKKLLCQ